MTFLDLFRTHWLYTRIEYSGQDGKTHLERSGQLDIFNAGLWLPLGETVSGMLEMRRPMSFREKFGVYLQEKFRAPSAASENSASSPTGSGATPSAGAVPSGMQPDPAEVRRALAEYVR